MSDVVISPNMNLPVPIVGVDPGPDWANNLNACLSGNIDAHDHSPGKGVQITPAGIDISTDLPFQGNNATLLRSTRYSPQASPLSLPTDIGCLYVSGVDLYYNDENGNVIRLTQSGSIVGTSGSISGLTPPASASYQSGSATFVWQSAVNTPANMDFASAILRNLTANSFGLTLSPPNAMGSDYTITLPSLPSSTMILTMTAAGQMAANLTVDNATLTISSGVIKVATGGIQQANLAPRSTGTTVAAGGVAVSASSGAFVTGAFGTPIAVTNLSVTITTTGRPVIVFLRGDGTSNISGVQSAQSTSSGASSVIQLVNGSTIISNASLDVAANVNDMPLITIPPSAVSTIDMTVNGTPGTYTYICQVYAVNPNNTTGVYYCQLVAYEI